MKFGGFPASKVKPSMFLERGKVFIIGRKPVRIDILYSFIAQSDAARA